MKKIGRNDPCPCGSGKKYKSCCLASAESSDFRYRHFGQIYEAIIPQLMAFASEIIEPDLFEEGWKEFNDYNEVQVFDAASPMNMLFMPWFLFNWVIELKPPGGKKFLETTIAEMFLSHNLDGLAADQQMLLRSSIRCPYTLCEIIEIQPRIGMTLLDLLRRIEFEVVERSASQTLKRGEIIYCAPSEVFGFKSNVGTGPYALRPTAKQEVQRLRRWIVEQIGDDSILTTHLYEFEYDIRGLYLHLLERMLAPPQLANTDGDPMVPQKLFFEISSADQAFHALKDLTEAQNESDLLKDAITKNGLVTNAEISWLGGNAEARKRFDGPVLLGVLKLDNGRLTVEVNSDRRAKLIGKLIKDRLGKDATYKRTLIEPIESQVKDMWQRAMGELSCARLGSEAPVGSRVISRDEEPELRVMMEESARQYWESWFDLPVPALNGMTPRQAAMTEEGRELLESLLLLYENQTDSSDHSLGPDVPRLRQILGLD